MQRAEEARQRGHVDLAIEELEGLVAEVPEDGDFANALGDLYVVVQRIGAALPLFLAAGDRAMRDGQPARAANAYRKILRLAPHEELVRLRVAEALSALGQSGDAHDAFSRVEEARRHRGDVFGADEVLLRIASLEGADVDSHLRALDVMAARRDGSAGDRFEALGADLESRGLFDEATRVYARLADRGLADGPRLERLCRRAWLRRDHVTVRTLATRGTPPPFGPLFALRLEVELSVGTPESVRGVVTEWLAHDRTAHPSAVALAIEASFSDVQLAWACVSHVADEAVSAGRPAVAERSLRSFLSTGVLHGPALVRWVELSVTAGLDSAVDPVRERLARLPSGASNPVTARAVLEAVARRVEPSEPWRALFEVYGLGTPSRERQP